MWLKYARGVKKPSGVRWLQQTHCSLDPVLFFEGPRKIRNSGRAHAQAKQPTKLRVKIRWRFLVTEPIVSSRFCPKAQTNQLQSC